MLAGVWIFLAPVVENFRNSQANAEITNSYLDGIRAVEGADPQQLTQSLRQAAEYNANLAPGSLHDPWSEDELAQDPAQAAYERVLSDAGAMARVQVPAVNIDLPVFHGTDRATLAKGAGHLYGTSLPVGGPDTHSVITGHTGMRAHPFFDRLVDVKAGDFILVDVAGERITYEVDQISLVLPHETEAVAVVPGADLITLLTCYTPPENTHRLLVRGHRVAGSVLPAPTVSETAATAPAVPADQAVPGAQHAAPEATVDYSIQEWMWPRLIAAAVAIGIWAVMIIGWVTSGRRERRKTAGAEPARRAQ